MFFSRAKALVGVLPFISAAYAGVFIQGFLDPVTCNQAVGSTTLNENGQCVEFNDVFVAIEVAGGGSDSCFLEVFFDPDCFDQSPTNVGPINDPNLGGCIGPFPGSTADAPIVAGRLLNCPT